MMLSAMKTEQRVMALFALALLSFALLLLLPPIAQDQGYHSFADQRTILGVPNFWNVMSNLPFVIVGAIGLWRHGRDPAIAMLFVGVTLTGFGSGYYHLDPNDSTLFWDRLPMAITFMAMLSIGIEDRIDAKVGARLLWPLIALAIVSLLIWRWTGDLRLYGWVQFFPCVVLVLFFVLFAPTYTGTSCWLAAAALYGLAKLFEHYDALIFSAGAVMSGHALKHLSAAGATLAILLYFERRRPVTAGADRTPGPLASWTKGQLDGHR